MRNARLLETNCWVITVCIISALSNSCMDYMLGFFQCFAPSGQSVHIPDPAKASSTVNLTPFDDLTDPSKLMRSICKKLLVK